MSNFINGVHKNSMSKFNSRDTAFNWAETSLIPSVVMHGDDGLYWVVSGRNSKKLIEANYERA